MFRQLGPSRYLIGNARRADLRLRAHDALSQGGGGAEVGARDLFRREPAQLAQRERHLRVRRQGRMTAGEDQSQPVVLDLLVVPRGGVAAIGGKPLGELRRPRAVALAGLVIPAVAGSLGQIGYRRAEPGTPPDSVDALEAAGGNEPGPRIGRHAVARPLLQRRTKGIVQRFLGQIEVAEQADQRGENATRLGAVDGVHRFAHRCERVLAHGRRAAATIASAPLLAITASILLSCLSLERGLLPREDRRACHAIFAPDRVVSSTAGSAAL